jgi:hypothetical protein
MIWELARVVYREVELGRRVNPVPFNCAAPATNRTAKPVNALSRIGIQRPAIAARCCAARLGAAAGRSGTSHSTS